MFTTEIENVSVALRTIILPMTIIAGLVFLVAFAIEIVESHAAKTASRSRDIDGGGREGRLKYP